MLKKMKTKMPSERINVTYGYGRLTVKDHVWNVIIYTLLALLAFATLYPFVYFLALSFNEGKDALRGGIYLWPRAFTLDNYARAFKDSQVLTSYKITILRTAIGTCMSLALTSMMAYGLTANKMPGHRGIVFFFFFTTLFGGGMIPTYILYKQLGLLNNFWVFIIPGLYSFYNTIVMKTFFEGIPEELKEAAKIDGAGDFRTFLQIVLPLSGSVIACIALFTAVGHWNDWFAGAYYISFHDELKPMATYLYELIAQSSFEVSQSDTGNVNTALMEQLQQQTTTTESLRVTFIIISVVPILCVYPFLQRYFVKGVMIGSLKG